MYPIAAKPSLSLSPFRTSLVLAAIAVLAGLSFVYWIPVPPPDADSYNPNRWERVGELAITLALLSAVSVLTIPGRPAATASAIGFGVGTAEVAQIINDLVPAVTISSFHVFFCTLGFAFYFAFTFVYSGCIALLVDRIAASIKRRMSGRNF